MPQVLRLDQGRIDAAAFRYFAIALDGVQDQPVVFCEDFNRLLTEKRTRKARPALAAYVTQRKAVLQFSRLDRVTQRTSRSCVTADRVVIDPRRVVLQKRSPANRAIKRRFVNRSRASFGQVKDQGERRDKAAILAVMRLDGAMLGALDKCHELGVPRIEYLLGLGVKAQIPLTFSCANIVLLGADRNRIELGELLKQCRHKGGGLKVREFVDQYRRIRLLGIDRELKALNQAVVPDSSAHGRCQVGFDNAGLGGTQDRKDRAFNADAAAANAVKVIAAVARPRLQDKRALGSVFLTFEFGQKAFQLIPEQQ